MMLGGCNMAEFCKECFMKMYGDLKGKKIIMSKDEDLCEDCSELKPVVIKIVYKNPIRQLILRLRGY